MQRRTFLVAASLGLAHGQQSMAEDSPVARQTPKLASLNDILKWKSAVLPLHEPKKANQAGDWLKQHEEAGQSFNQYQATAKGRLCQKYRAIYIQPLGEFTQSQQTVVDKVAEFMGHFFQMPVELLADKLLTDLAATARRIHPIWNVPQVLSTHLLNQVLKPIRPQDAVAVLGLTAEDLWPGDDWNFVFGQASLSERVGVWSLHRNGKVDGSANEQQQFLRRTLKTATHETGHMLGIPHCIAFECGMNGANNLSESDRQPLEFCPECQAKLSWASGCSFASRYQALATVAEQQGFVDEAAFWTQSLAAVV